MNKKSFMESISDTFIGLCINFPLGFTVLVVMTWFTTNPLYISGAQTVVLTITAIIRRYLTREYFRIRLRAK